MRKVNKCTDELAWIGANQHAAFIYYDAPSRYCWFFFLICGFDLWLIWEMWVWYLILRRCGNELNIWIDSFMWYKIVKLYVIYIYIYINKCRHLILYPLINFGPWTQWWAWHMSTKGNLRVHNSLELITT